MSFQNRIIPTCVGKRLILSFVSRFFLRKHITSVFVLYTLYNPPFLVFSINIYYTPCQIGNIIMFPIIITYYFSHYCGIFNTIPYKQRSPTSGKCFCFLKRIQEMIEIFLNTFTYIYGPINNALYLWIGICTSCREVVQTHSPFCTQSLPSSTNNKLFLLVMGIGFNVYSLFL